MDDLTDDMMVQDRAVFRLDCPVEEIDLALAGLSGVTVTSVNRDEGWIEFETPWSEPHALGGRRWES